jgi:hypothetical protein
VRVRRGRATVTEGVHVDVRTSASQELDPAIAPNPTMSGREIPGRFRSLVDPAASLSRRSA